ncbi:MAG: hypothetical protein JW751_20540 [Polyangiaceae bacterium]|nr:hypothetical protein [Polyangiaceae bacterium]
MASDRPPPNELGARLFAAARQEVPAADVRQRTLAAMIGTVQARGQRRRGRWQVAAPLLLAAAGVALCLARRPPAPAQSEIAREPVAAHPSTTPSAAVSSEREAPEPLPSHRRPPAPSPTLRSSGPRAAPSLSEELTALDRARGALERGQPTAALAELDAYQRAGGRRLVEEAEVLRIEALARAGEDSAARALARRFLATHPGSPLVDRVRSFLGSGAPQPTTRP